MSEDPYLIPGSYVLRNKLGIEDRAELDRVERSIVVQRMREGCPTGDFNLNHLRAIHRHLFQDVYNWAGEIRTVDMQKERSVFIPASRIEQGISYVHQKLVTAQFLVGLSDDDFAAKAAEVIGDINYAHPFREGNGRTQLEYLRQLGARAGHALNPGLLDRDTWLSASRAAHTGDYSLMAKAIREQAMLPKPPRGGGSDIAAQFLMSKPKDRRGR